MIYKFIDDHGAEITVNSLSQLQTLVEDKTIKKDTKLKVGLRGKWGKAKDVQELKFEEEEKKKKKEKTVKELEDIESYITSEPTPPSPSKKEITPKIEKTKIDIEKPIETEKIASKQDKVTAEIKEPSKVTTEIEEPSKEEINKVKEQTIDPETRKNKNITLFFKKLWQGTHSLKLSFWGLYLLPNLIFSILLFFLMSNVLKTKDLLIYELLFYTATLATIIYLIVSMVGTWKSANYFRKIEGNKASKLGIVAQIFISVDVLLRIIGVTQSFV
tara:strand:- start:47 stop:865 length:819 start_codon:yes stop_codon:yes gene_type:complete